jgi:hypothetical protein
MFIERADRLAAQYGPGFAPASPVKKDTIDQHEPR